MIDEENQKTSYESESENGSSTVMSLECWLRQRALHMTVCTLRHEAPGSRKIRLPGRSTSGSRIMYYTTP